MIITIDGPAGTGKTTVAKLLASDLGFTYFDTGAMYRALTYGIISKNINIDDQEEFDAFLNQFPVSIKSRLGEKYIFLGDENVTENIRSNGVTGLVSKISSMRKVREVLVKTQRELSRGVNAVFEGRDMGTVVFPNADLKIFLTASPEIRAKRRFDELKQKYPNEFQNTTLESTLEEINKRDELDASRDISPMKPAENAIILDNSELSIDEVVNRIINLKEKGESKSLN